jgi:glycosyltransferase involved in cell wall biosynthesis
MLLSIIIPVYNSSPYLKRCLDSVLGQTYTDFELLIINDGSEDDSLSICRKYEQQDRRIKVFSKPNGGVSSARNVGLAHASGQWICFIDSDDYVEKNHLEKLTADIGDSIDFIMHGKHGLPKYSHSNYHFKIVDTDNKRELFEEVKISPNGQVYSKLFLHAIIKKYNIRFQDRYTHLKRTYFNFLVRAVNALHLNGYSKSERLNKYEALNSCIKLNKMSIDYRTYGVKFMYNLFLNRKYKSFDLLVDSLHHRNLLYKFLDVLNN